MPAVQQVRTGNVTASPSPGSPLYSSVQAIDPAHLERLRRVNLLVGMLHLIQAAVMLGMSGGLRFPVTVSFLAADPITAQPASPEVVFQVPYGPLVALFLGLAALDHLLVVAPRINRRYNEHLARGTNPYRWYEYSVSASLMLVLIALLVGIWDLVALIGLFALNTTMIWFGLLMERHQRPGPSADWRAFRFGAIAGAVPWAMIAIHLLGGASPPAFVYLIFVSLFTLFAVFGLFVWLHFREVGRFGDTVYYEQGFIWLSLAAKSALAWQIFANVLRA